MSVRDLHATAERIEFAGVAGWVLVAAVAWWISANGSRCGPKPETPVCRRPCQTGRLTLPRVRVQPFP